MFANCFILILFVMGCTFASRQYGCPDKHDLAPCTCNSIFTHSVNLICSKIDDVEVLKRVFSNSKRYTFDKVFLQFSNFQALPTSMFDDVRVEYIDLENVTAISLFDGAPPAELELHTIVMQNTKFVRGMEWYLFQNQNMKTLRISYVKIKNIGPEFEQNIKEDLKWLEIVHCNLKSLSSGALQKYKNLDKITMSYNRINKLQRDYFPTPYNGQSLEFNNNKLTSLPYDLFTQMTGLKFVDFSSNQFSQIPALTGLNPINVWYFYFHDNPLRCDCRLFWMIVAKPQTIKGACTEPKNFEGRELADLTAHEFPC